MPDDIATEPLEPEEEIDPSDLPEVGEEDDIPLSDRVPEG